MLQVLVLTDQELGQALRSYTVDFSLVRSSHARVSRYRSLAATLSELGSRMEALRRAREVVEDRIRRDTGGTLRWVTNPNRHLNKPQLPPSKPDGADNTISRLPPSDALHEEEEEVEFDDDALESLLLLSNSKVDPLDLVEEGQ